MSWLPLVMPRPELFEATTFPELGDRNRKEIISVLVSNYAEPQSLLWEEENGNIVSRSFETKNDEEYSLLLKAQSDKTCSILPSLPIFVWVYLFSCGYNNDKLHKEEDVRSENLIFYISRSFISWRHANETDPVYRKDRMVWKDNIPYPDLSDVPQAIPVQVVVPFHRTQGSAHHRFQLASKLEEDLNFLAKINKWGAPLRPRYLAIPGREAFSS